MLFKPGSRSHNQLITRGLIAAGLLLTAGPALAQTGTDARVQDTNFNTWLMYFSDARLAKRWGVHTEVQWRRAEGLGRPLQLLLRPGLNFHASDKVLLTGGYAFVRTHPYGDYPASEKFPEHRLYEQLLLKSGYGPVLVSHRYRLEQRWVRRAGNTHFTYLNRARYLVRAVLPLVRAADGLTPKTPYLAAYDEVFVNFGANVARNIFDQNRAYAAVGYQFTKATSVELGYLHHLVAQGNGRVFEHNHTLQVALNFNPDFRKSE